MTTARELQSEPGRLVSVARREPNEPAKLLALTASDAPLRWSQDFGCRR